MYAIEHLGSNASGACAAQAGGGVLCQEEFAAANGSSISVTLVTDAAEDVQIDLGEGTVVGIAGGAAGQDVAVTVFQDDAAAVATSGAAAGEADLVSNVVDIIFAGGANTSGLVHVSLSLDIAPLAFGGDGCVVPTILGVVFGGQARV